MTKIIVSRLRARKYWTANPTQTLVIFSIPACSLPHKERALRKNAPSAHRTHKNEEYSLSRYTRSPHSCMLKKKKEETDNIPCGTNEGSLFARFFSVTSPAV